jgi:hypothetical protein
MQRNKLFYKIFNNLIYRKKGRKPVIDKSTIRPRSPLMYSEDDTQDSEQGPHPKYYEHAANAHPCPVPTQAQRTKHVPPAETPVNRGTRRIPGSASSIRLQTNEAERLIDTIDKGYNMLSQVLARPPAAPAESIPQVDPFFVHIDSIMKKFPPHEIIPMQTKIQAEVHKVHQKYINMQYGNPGSMNAMYGEYNIFTEYEMHMLEY